MPESGSDRVSLGGLSVFPGNHPNLSQRRPQRLVYGDAAGPRIPVNPLAPRRKVALRSG